MGCGLNIFCGLWNNIFVGSGVIVFGLWSNSFVGYEVIVYCGLWSE